MWSDWQLPYLEHIADDPDLFLLPGRNKYAKCATLTLGNMMTDLPRSGQTMQNSLSGAHVARQEQQFWAGISTNWLWTGLMMTGCERARRADPMDGVWKRAKKLMGFYGTPTTDVAIAGITNLKLLRWPLRNIRKWENQVIRDKPKSAERCYGSLRQHQPVWCLAITKLRGLVSGMLAADSDNSNCDEVERLLCVTKDKWRAVQGCQR